MDFAQTSAVDYVVDTFVTGLQAQALVVGADTKGFGAGYTGDVELLRRLVGAEELDQVQKRLKSMADKAQQAGEALKAVGQTLSLVRAELEPERALIGFAGAPWTVATYMVAGQGSKDQGETRAYAYLVAPPERQMTDAAEKRLKVLSDLDSLGAGFQLASHDLDIRGAGNLLGDEQSGHIREVGYELYQSMLEDAIMEAKAGGLRDRPRDFSPQITVDAPILIPEDYVPDLDLRMGLYRRLNEVDDREGLDMFAAEMIDRFGPLPEATDNLVKVIEIKLNAKKACVAKIDVGPKGALVTFHDDRPPNVEGLLAYVARLGEIAKLRPDSKFALSRSWPDPKARLNGALQLSKGLAKAAG